LRLFNTSSIKTKLKSFVNYILSILLISAETRLSADELHTEVTGPAAGDEIEPASSVSAKLAAGPLKRQLLPEFKATGGVPTRVAGKV
jgi:hypothetical protein